MSEKLSERMLDYFRVRYGGENSTQASFIAEVSSLERQLAEALDSVTEQEYKALADERGRVNPYDLIAARRRRIMGEGE